MPRINQTNLAPGQQSVWEYPRPPRVENCSRRIRVIFDGIVIADSINTKRMLETSHPPVYYIPPEDVRMELLVKNPHNSFCEWKGAASYYSIRTEGRAAEDATWGYHSPNTAYAV